MSRGKRRPPPCPSDRRRNARSATGHLLRSGKFCNLPSRRALSLKPSSISFGASVTHPCFSTDFSLAVNLVRIYSTSRSFSRALRMRSLTTSLRFANSPFRARTKDEDRLKAIATGQRPARYQTGFATINQYAVRGSTFKPEGQMIDLPALLVNERRYTPCALSLNACYVPFSRGWRSGLRRCLIGPRAGGRQSPRKITGVKRFFLIA